MGFGGPPETRTPDPLIKSPFTVRIQPTLAYSSEENLSVPLVAFSGFQMERTDYTRTQQYFALMSNRLCHQARVPALWPENGAGLRIIQWLLGHAASNEHS